MKRLLFVTILILLSTIEAKSYETNVHQAITSTAIASSNIGLYLKNNLNINLTDNFNNRTAQEWMEMGGKWEDDNLTMRWLNHFYDPTTGKGLNTAGIIIYGDPSLKWGKLALNAWDWESARDYYYSALTSTNENDREKAFANTFRALGQIIHLIQDKAVPAHVRNDAHPPFLTTQRDMYEKYTTEKASSLKYVGYSSVDITTFNSFDSFWINSGKGLAEYTNSNFLSRNTNIDDNKYASPVGIGEWGTTETVYDPDYGWIYVDVRYLQGYATDNYRSNQSSPINRLSAFSYFDYEANKYLGKPGVYSLNNYVHKEYSDLLLPRAVGYSAGLLNYFFRGNIGIELDQNAPDELVVINLSSERMTGDFALYYDDSSNNRNFIKSWTLDITPYSLEYVPLSACNLSKLTPEPEKFILAFQGTMGSETGAVVGNANITSLKTTCGTELTISGLDTISQNTTQQYTVAGCTGCADDVTWTVSGTGASIDENGILTISNTACGTVRVKADCQKCNLSNFKDIKAACDAPFTITGPDTIAKNSTQQYTAEGCCGNVNWFVIGKGAVIDSNGLLTTDETACGLLTVIALCPDCDTFTIKDVKAACDSSLVISGSDTITKNSTEQYIAEGCCGQIEWTVSGTGASIDENGLLTTDETACGTITVTADCPDCNLSISKDVKVICDSLTITGSDTTIRNSTKQYTASGCCAGGIVWSVSVGSGSQLGGSTITEDGVLTAGATACGSLIITASCSICNTSVSQAVRVTDAGHWVIISDCGKSVGGAGGWPWTECIVGNRKYLFQRGNTNHYACNGCCCNLQWSCENREQKITSASCDDCSCIHTSYYLDSLVSRLIVFEWRC